LNFGSLVLVLSPVSIRRNGAKFLREIKVYYVVEVGEYESDYEFSLPNLVSVRREYLRLWFQIGRCVLNFRKNEDTWYGVLEHYDAEDDIALRVLKGQW